jgi:hypothetical protein
MLCELCEFAVSTADIAILCGTELGEVGLRYRMSAEDITTDVNWTAYVDIELQNRILASISFYAGYFSLQLILRTILSCPFGQSILALLVLCRGPL